MDKTRGDFQLPKVHEKKLIKIYLAVPKMCKQTSLRAFLRPGSGHAFATTFQDFGTARELRHS